MRLIEKLVLIASLLFVISNVFAQVRVNTARVEITEQNRGRQVTLGQAALSQVFVKISGDRNIVEADVIKRAIKNYEQYLITSRYGQEQDFAFFEARFNQEKIIQLLKVSGLPVWSELRPNAVIWLASNINKNIESVSQNSGKGLANTIKNTAQSRGVEIYLPIGDLEDTLALDAFDIWTQNINKIKSQSFRYNADFIISASINPIRDDLSEVDLDALNQTASAEQPIDPEEIEVIDEVQNQIEQLDETFDSIEDTESDNAIEENTAAIKEIEIPEGASLFLNYAIIEDTKTDVGRIYGTTENEVTAELIHKFADKLARQFAVVGTDTQESQRIIIQISNIKSLQSLHEVQEIFSSMPIVRSAHLKQQNVDKAIFEIDMVDQLDKFLTLIEIDQRLTRDLSQENDLQTISFFWNR
ncbi:DUF2066 domain-containing protein [Glaciecola sp. 1036]|uniref:DUF2066 domain-containing protein n=1 Tax=Alteromonadaceae TaxID=72275 RepID=UPI003D023AE2